MLLGRGLYRSNFGHSYMGHNYVLGRGLYHSNFVLVDQLTENDFHFPSQQKLEDVGTKPEMWQVFYE